MYRTSPIFAGILGKHSVWFEAIGTNVFFQAILRFVPVFEVHVYGYVGYEVGVYFLDCVHVWEIMWDMVDVYFKPVCICGEKNVVCVST